MDGYSISQVAERSGFSASALRFYDQAGLVQPTRTRSGYRRYDDDDLDVLGFIARAKRLGLSLDEIAELVALRSDDRCAPVQDHLRELLDERLAATQARIAELVAFAGDLQRVGAGLSGHTPDGPCDDRCGCTTDTPAVDAAGVGPVRVALVDGPASRTDDAPPIACTLDPERVEGRLADWRSVLGRAHTREAIDGGVRASFGADVEVGALAELAAAEQACCRFFTFALVLDGRGVHLDITGPDDARPVIDAMAGVPA